MRKETNLEELKAIAKNFLYIEVEETNIPGIVIHPIFESNMVYIQDKKKFVDIFQDTEEVNEVYEYYEKLINSCDNIGRIIWLIRKSYRLTFLKYAKEYLSKNDFDTFLGNIYVDTENPNGDVNVSVRTLRSWFAKANKKNLMTGDEYKYYNSLPEQITVYRGVGISRKEKGLSWTQNIEKARWFANRFNRKGQTGYVVTASISKDEILAYFGRRGEEEIVCLPDEYTVIC